MQLRRAIAIELLRNKMKLRYDISACTLKIIPFLSNQGPLIQNNTNELCYVIFDYETITL